MIRRRRFAATTATIATIAFLLLTTQSANAQPAPTTTDTKPLAESLTGGAKADYVAGRALFDDGDFGAALVKFKSSMEASKDKRLFWNLAAAERGLRHYGEAIRDLEKYKIEAGSLLTEKDKTDADEIIAGLRPYVAAFTVHANELGADVLIDEVAIGQTPLEKFYVDIGTHKLLVRKDGFADFSTPFEISNTGDVVRDVQLAKAIHEGRISVVAAAGDSINLDGKTVGVQTYEGTISSGLHVVKVTADGKKPFEQRVVIEDGKLRTLDVNLESKPILPLWAWIGIGAAAATGLTIGGYFTFRSTEEKLQPVQGTMQPFTVQLPSWHIR